MRDGAKLRREHRAEEREGEEHRQLGRRLAILEEAVAEVVVERRDRRPGREHGEEAAAADRFARDVCREDGAHSVERPVDPADVGPRASNLDQLGEHRADCHPRERPEHEEAPEEGEPVGRAAGLAERDRREDQDQGQDDHVVGAGLGLEREADGSRDPLVPCDVAQQDRVDRGEDRAKEQSLHRRQPEQEAGGERDEDHGQEGSRAEGQNGHDPATPELVEAEVDRVEVEHEAEADDGNDLQRWVVSGGAE